VPDRPPAQVRGLRKAPLAAFGAVQARIRGVDHGNLILTDSEIEVTREVDTDAGLLARGWATITVLRVPCFDADPALPELAGLRRAAVGAHRDESPDMRTTPAGAIFPDQGPNPASTLPREGLE